MTRAVVADFTAEIDPAFAEVVESIVSVLRSVPESLDVAVKWRQLAFARDGDFHHWICAIAVTKRGVSLNFHFGGLLDDPDSRLIAGSSRFLRRLEYRSAADVDGAAILAFVTQALDKLAYFKANWKTIQVGSAAG